MTVNVVPDGAMPYGIQLPVQAKSIRTSMAWERDPSVGTAELVRAAKACDDAGFFYVAVCDHVQVPPAAANEGGMSSTWYDPIATLSYLAALTTRTRLMTNVYVAAYRKPLQTAKHFATLDALSGGRVILGVGAGHLAARVRGPRRAVHDPWQGARRRDRRHRRRVVRRMHRSNLRRCNDRARRSGSADRARPRCGASPSAATAGSRRARRASRCPTSIAVRSGRHRDKVRPDVRLDIGYIHEYVYVGDASWDFDGEYTVTGSDERIVDKCNDMGAMGVNHLQVRLRARDVEEFCDQAAAFGERIGPHLVSGGSL